MRQPSGKSLNYFRFFIAISISNYLSFIILCFYISLIMDIDISTLMWFDVVNFNLLVLFLSFIQSKFFFGYVYYPIANTFHSISEKITSRHTAFYIPIEHQYSLQSIEYCFEQILDQLDAHQKSLLDSELSYSTILDTQNEFVMIINTDGFIKYSNRAFTNFFDPGNDLNEYFDISLDVFNLPESVVQIIESASEAIKKAEISGKAQAHMSTVHINDTVYHISWVIKSIPAHPENYSCETELLLVGRDETQSRTMEERTRQLESLATVGRVVSTVSHEINQPLSVIRLSVSNLLDLCENNQLSREEAKGKFMKILSQIDRTNKIIRDLKLFNSTTQRVSKESKFKIQPVLLEIIDNQKLILDKSGINLIVELSSDCIQVRGNITLFEQAIHNLISNSIDALSDIEVCKRQKTITIKCLVKKNNVLITVLDNGPGVPDHLLKKIAAPFFSTKLPGAGSGLGLSLCYDIIQKMNGNLLFSNSSEGGFKVDITIPII